MNKNFIEKFLIVVVFSLLPGIAPILAQSTVSGGIRGKVTDSPDATVPNASCVTS